MTEFYEMNMAIENGTINAGEIIWHVCSGQTSTSGVASLTGEQGYDCYEMMCERFCASHSNQGGCTCTGHEHTAILEIYDLDSDQAISRDEFNALVAHAEALMVPWPYHIYIGGNQPACMRVATVALIPGEVEVELQACCDEGTQMNPQDANLMLACATPQVDPVYEYQYSSSMGCLEIEKTTDG